MCFVAQAAGSRVTRRSIWCYDSVNAGTGGVPGVVVQLLWLNQRVPIARPVRILSVFRIGLLEFWR